MTAPPSSQPSPRPGLSAFMRRAGLGRLVYQVVHRPLNFLSRWRRFGPLNFPLTALGARQMERAARRLPPIGSSISSSEQQTAGDPPSIHFLTGKAFWYQTCFCAWSLMRHASSPLHLVVYDDGTLDASCRSALLHVFPHMTIVPREEIEQRLDRVLPTSRYPWLRNGA